MRKAQVIMGTGVTIDIPAANENSVFNDAFALLKRIDRDYSPYKKDSLVSRYARGELKWWRRSREFRSVLKACHEAQAATDGAFSAYASGKFDPSGYVKGWAIQRASDLIERAGFSTYCISIGGDINARGGKKSWAVGIQDPKNKLKSVLAVNLKNAAIATSGNYIRGSHIYNPKTRRPVNDLLSVTVAGPSIVEADILATAAFVLGEFALNFIGGQAKGYDALVIYKNGKIDMSPGFVGYLAD